MAGECDLTKDGGDVELRSDQCVNAFHGIADPAAYMAWAKRLEEAATACCEALDYSPDDWRNLASVLKNKP